MKTILYVKTGCPWCQDVLDLFAEKQIIFELRNVTENKADFEEMVRKSGQTKTPTLDIDGRIYADSDREQVAKLLGIL